ncbi:receptor-like protein eix2 [Quercus suber]|uniref:Receptor-like protein eix2 n=1 Tax=Quercus suber TaxID=58331 RepID=A0AAW0JX28_QUESU
MTSLKHLDLSANNFNSSIPNWLYSFSHLEFLNLRKNLLQGTISSSIRNLTSAISIDLTSNQLDGKVPRSLGNVCKLRELRLSDNKFSQEVSKILESLLRCVSYGLEVLEMYDAQLSGHLIEGLGQFQNLSTLSLEGNSIWGPIPISIGKLSSLRFLDLSHNQFNGTLPQSFGGLSKLEHVFIGGNMLEGVVSETHFANLRRLKGLSTTPNRFTLKVSPNWIPPFQVLFLGLGSWILGPNFPLWICSQKRVWSLDISNTNVTDAIPPLFWNMSSQFYYLSLSHNHIYGEIPNIPVTLYPSSVIDMSSNSFNGSLPLISSNDLFVLDGDSVDFERLNLVIKGQVREYTTNLGLLRTIDLSKNNLSGEIPKEVTSLQGLQSLNLSFNNLIGRIPENIGAMGSLESLDFSKNQLSDIIIVAVVKGTQPGPWTETTMKKPGFSTAKAEKFKLGSLTTVLSVKEVQSLASLALKARVAVVMDSMEPTQLDAATARPTMKPPLPLHVISSSNPNKRKSSSSAWDHFDKFIDKEESVTLVPGVKLTDTPSTVLGETRHLTSQFLASEEKAVMATSKVEALEAEASGLQKDLIAAMDAYNTSKEQVKTLVE